MPDDKEIERVNSIKKMMEACDKDSSLQAQLLREPDALAKKHGVQLRAEEKAQLAKVSELYSIIDEFKAGRVAGPGPIFYPIDVWWKRKIFDHVLRYRPLYYPMFYPIDIGRIDLLRQFDELQLRRR